MLGLRLVHLIESHSESLSRQLSRQIRNSERTSDFRNIPDSELHLAAAEIYRHLGDWLLRKTESDIARLVKPMAARRAAQGIRLHQYIWALILTRDHLWRFLRSETFDETVLQLHEELELHQMLRQFFDRAIYFAVLGYEDALHQSTAKGNLARARDLAVAIGLMSAVGSDALEK